MRLCFSARTEQQPFLAVSIFFDPQAAPGGWSLFASEMVGRRGSVVAVDLLGVDGQTVSLLKRNTDFRFVEGDFTTANVKEKIAESLRPRVVDRKSDDDPRSSKDARHLGRADVIMSDMAANFTGVKITDALRTMSLCEDALAFAIGSFCFEHHDDDDDDASIRPLSHRRPSWNELGLLRIGGAFLCKFFSCGRDNEEDLRTSLARHFERVDSVKPPASRKESAEQYLIATGYRGNRVLASMVNRAFATTGDVSKS